MNTTDDTIPGNTPENMPSDQGRPFGFWIRAVDRLLAAEFATAFEDEGIVRRDWRILNAIGGTVPRGREMPDRKLHDLARLGWIERTADGWALTADGTAAQARLTAAVAEMRAQVAGSLEPEEFAAMTASLKKLARGLGYEEGARLPRHPGARHDDDHGRRGHDRHRRGHGGNGWRTHGEERFERNPGFERHPGFDRHPGFERHPGFGHEFPHREHRHDEHPHREHRHEQHPHEQHPHERHLHGEHPHGVRARRGRGPAEGAPSHLHIHLHDGHRNG